MEPTAVLATLTGRDRPGVTASLCAALAAYDVDIRDIEQIVIRDRLMLAVLFDLRGDAGALRGSLTRTASALGMESEVVLADGRPPSPPGTTAHVTLVGRPLRPGAIAHVAQHIADHGGNIDAVVQQPDDVTPLLELTVRAPDVDRLRGAVFRAGGGVGLDVAVQRDAVRRCAKRLVLLDVGSTLLADGAIEAVDLLAERAGVTDEVRRITERESAGDLDDGDALRARAALLAGMSESEVRATAARTQPRPEAGSFTRTLRGLGYRVGAVSGGFGLLADQFTDDLSLDYFAVNRLEIRDGIVTGQLLEPVLDARGRNAALTDFARREGVPLEQTVAVGSSEGDLGMLREAGLGIACTGAEHRPSSYLESVLVVLGVSPELREAALSA